MSQKLPADFDADRYAASYPDVALSGLKPEEHYLRFGRLMERNPKGKGSGPEAPPHTSPPPVAPVMPRPAETQTKPQEPATSQAPIIDRPSDFDSAEITPAPAPPKRSRSAEGPCGLAELADGPFDPSEDRARLCAPLSTYVRMFSLEAGELPPSGEISIGSGPLWTADTRIENAWFVEPRILRLMIAGPSAPDASAAGWAIRAYQANPTDPANFKPAGPGVQLPSRGPVFHDVELSHPLMPVLLELSDRQDVTRDIGLLAFPSLLPGGMHGAELMAFQSEPNPMDAFWHMSETLVSELLGDADSAKRSITELAACASETRDCVPSTSTDVQDWLKLLFGLGFSDPNPKTKSKGLRLTLPADSLPTISALVSRRLNLGSGSNAVGPFLVAESSGYRPRWSVSLPITLEPNPRLPTLQRTGRSAAGNQHFGNIPVHLAIALRSSDAGEIRLPESTKAFNVAPSFPMTIILESTDFARTETLLTALRASVDGSAELIVRYSHSGRASPSSLEEICRSHPCTAILTSTDPRKLARRARHERILTISDRVSLNFDALEAITKILEEDSTAASASCVLLGETIFKKRTVLQPASGGLFPSRVSFASSPRLGFAEPDVLQALSGLTYPVVANTMHFAVWRTSALAELPPLSGPVPATAADIRLGLDLMKAGYRNFCTAKARTRIAGPYARRDSIDPIGSAYLAPGDWEDLLNRVTILRELF